MKLSYVFIGLCFSASVLAHGPTPQKTDESLFTSLTKPAVWKTVTAPCSIEQWHPEVTKCEATAERKQTLTLKNGKTVLQEIDDIDDKNMIFAYRLGGEIDTEALKVSSLFGKIKVMEEEGKTKINWSARYYRAYTGNQPPEGQDDATAKATIDAFVKSGLEGLSAGNATASSIEDSPKTASNDEKSGAFDLFLKVIGLR